MNSPQSKWFCREENRWYDFVHPSSGQGYSALPVVGDTLCTSPFNAIRLLAVVIDLTGQNWVDIASGEEPGDRLAAWKSAGRLSFENFFFFPSPIPYAFHMEPVH